ncbi:MAG: thiamine-phosphate kinase [Bdellovibrionaceae bacterium]|nr:thiamine-phosphate kinase [Pseudobdellovibrionaceae bacterium]
MILSDIGELNLISLLSSELKQTLPSQYVGIGDDAAVIPLSHTHSLVITTDLLTENVHFLKHLISPKDLGHKSLAVNLSDIAAMGGVPQSAFISLALPISTSVEWVKEVYQGVSELAQKHNVLILGGDTTKSPKGIVINITLVGTIKTSQCKLRSQAQIGDIICVTGHLGDSAAGLRLLLETPSSKVTTDAALIQTTSPFARDTRPTPFTDTDQTHKDRSITRTNYKSSLIQQHIRPYPFIHESQWLAQHPDVHAMMDLSDGLHLDLPKILEQSSCGAEIELSHLPLSKALISVAQEYGWDKFELALSGGEDYCLLLTVAPENFATLVEGYNKKFNTSLWPIGKILPQTLSLTYTYQNKPHPISLKGFEHFK